MILRPATRKGDRGPGSQGESGSHVESGATASRGYGESGGHGEPEGHGEPGGHGEPEGPDRAVGVTATMIASCLSGYIVANWSCCRGQREEIFQGVSYSSDTH